MSTFPIKVHQCISGFTQSERRCHGVLKLSEKLHELGFNNRISRVSLRPWNDDWATVAENIWLLGQHHDAEVVVNIYAYSWGGGWGAVQLARELKKRASRSGVLWHLTRFIVTRCCSCGGYRYSGATFRSRHGSRFRRT